MKVREVPFVDFKQGLDECVKNGDFTYDQVKDMQLSEFLAFLTKRVTKNMNVIEEWLQLNEHKVRLPQGNR